jgi:hypothetical protein
MSATLQLNCLVFGQDPSHVFQVEIEKTKMVAALKDAIKDGGKQTFRDVDADSLMLWAESIPVDRELKQKLSNFDLDEQSLSLLDDLIEVFSDSPARKHLHIIVRPPPSGECQSLWPAVLSLILLSSDTDLRRPSEPTPVDRIFELNSLVFGDDPSHVFQVEIEKTKTVAALKDAIKDKKTHTFRDVDADSLDLWVASIPFDSNLNGNVNHVNLVEERSLSPVDRSSKVFSDEPSEGCLHIILQPSHPGEHSGFIVLIQLTSKKPIHFTRMV